MVAHPSLGWQDLVPSLATIPSSGGVNEVASHVVVVKGNYIDSVVRPLNHDSLFVDALETDIERNSLSAV